MRELNRLVAEQERCSCGSAREVVDRRKQVEFTTATWYQAVIEVFWDSK